MSSTAPHGVLPHGDELFTATRGLAADNQSLTPGDIVVLFDIDTAPIGGTEIWYLCSGLVDGAAPMWKGHTYAPHPIVAEGFEWAGRGQLPRPKLTVGNALGLLQAAVVQYNDLLGARVTRWKTLKKYLDGQPDADPDTHYIPDVYHVDRKVSQTKGMIEFDLSAALDQQGVMLPRRQIIRDACTETYRKWDAAANDFVYGTCPYAGDARFTAKDAPTDAAHLDVCSHKLSGCKARYGADGELPFSGFPAVSRTR
ncbi:MAG: phage minor tail protein L [Proteobacteria bacterium]|nr:phage minor tail protein L [Pseudomonadota bacterium]